MRDDLTTATPSASLTGPLDDELAHLPSFGRFVELKNVTTGGMTPFSWDRWHPEQRRFEMERTGRDLVLKGRQMGFSTLELVRDLQYARTHEGVRVQIVVHDRDEKETFFERLKVMARALERWGICPPPRYSTKTEIAWADNNSGVYITEAGASEGSAKKTGRSGTIDRLHATEAAFWGSPKETWASLDGSMEHGDEVVIESTADGADTWFHGIWLATVDGRFSGFTPHFFPWFEHPGREADPRMFARAQTSREQKWEDRLVDEFGISEAQLAWWRSKVQSLGGLDVALAEQPPTPEAAFQSSGGAWIDPEWLDELDRHVEKPRRLLKLRHGTLRIYREPIDGEPYIITGDVSEGSGGDEAAICVGHHRTGEVCAVWDDQSTSPKELGRLMAEVGTLYNKALAAPEIEGMRNEGREPIGVVTLKELEELGYRNIYVHQSSDEKRGRPRKGWPTNRDTRPSMIEDMADGISRCEIRSPDRKMVAETRSMVRKGGRVQARGKASGTGDDGVFFTWAIFHQVRQRARIRRPGGHRIEGIGSLVSADFRT